MLNPPRCQNCGVEKKTREGKYMPKCGLYSKESVTCETGGGYCGIYREYEKEAQIHG